jgi:hypothetical protein
MSIVLADYKDKIDSFRAMLEPDCECRILMFQGQSGFGKTALINACLENLPNTVQHIPIQLRASAVGVTEIFHRAGQQLGWETMPNFTAQVAALSGVSNINIDGNSQTGINNRISIALRAENPTDREERRTTLTSAWFEDLGHSHHIVLLALDTYEQATNDVKEWVSGPFLYRATQTNNIRVLLGGQEIPDKHNIEWASCCSMHELPGVYEAEHWLPVVHALGRKIPEEQALSWLAGVCFAFNGRPDAILNTIKNLPLG